MKKNKSVPKYTNGKKKVNDIRPVIPVKNNSAALIVIIAFCVPVLLYLQTLKFGFTGFDDSLIISNNVTFLHDLGNAPKVFLTDAFLDKSSSFHRPLQTLSFMTDMKLAEGNHIWMFHLSNILLLGAISCLLFLLLRRFMIPPKLALAGTLIYCAHPLFVFTIAYIPTRGELLLTFFSLLSFLFLIAFIQKKRFLNLLIHWATFTLALFCKETAAFVPVIFMLYYFAFAADKAYNKRYLFIILLYAVSITIWFLLRSIAVGGISNGSDSIGTMPLLINLRTIPEALSKFFLFFGIAPIAGFTVYKTLAGLTIVALILAMFFKSKERAKKEKLFAVSWFLVLMLPPMFLKHPHIDYLDHRFFFPLMGILLFTLFVFPKKWMANGDIRRGWLWMAVIAALGSFTFITTRSYADPASFFNYAIACNSNSALAYYDRGIIRAGKTDLQGAIGDFDKAITIDPNYVEAYYNRGTLKYKVKDREGAIADFTKTINLSSGYAEAYNNRGNANNSLGNFKSAIIDLDKALALNPALTEAYYNRAIARSNTADKAGAIADYSKAIALDPAYAKAYNNRGGELFVAGNFSQAIMDFNKAIEINPDYYGYYYNKANAEYSTKDFANASADCEKALGLNASDEKTLNLQAKIQKEIQGKSK